MLTLERSRLTALIPLALGLVDDAGLRAQDADRGNRIQAGNGRFYPGPGRAGYGLRPVWEDRGGPGRPVKRLLNRRIPGESLIDRRPFSWKLRSLSPTLVIGSGAHTLGAEWVRAHHLRLLGAFSLRSWRCRLGKRRARGRRPARKRRNTGRFGGQGGHRYRQAVARPGRAIPWTPFYWLGSRRKA
jgi:hypothetical protein